MGSRRKTVSSDPEGRRAVPNVTIELAGVRQRAISFMPGRCYLYQYGGSALEAFETLQLTIEASRTPSATLASWLWPETTPNSMRETLERACVQQLEGVAAVFARAHIATQREGDDEFVAFLLAIAQATLSLPLPVLVAHRLPEHIARPDAARAAAAAGLVPITAVRIESAPELTDGMAAIADIACTGGASNPTEPPLQRQPREHAFEPGFLSSICVGTKEAR